MVLISSAVKYILFSLNKLTSFSHSFKHTLLYQYSFSQFELFFIPFSADILSIFFLHPLRIISPKPGNKIFLLKTRECMSLPRPANRIFLLKEPIPPTRPARSLYIREAPNSLSISLLFLFVSPITLCLINSYLCYSSYIFFPSLIATTTSILF